ncbi:MAG TPA: pitrilysin family protein [Bacteroidales bacterium]|nr:pitrilysin family protein [Bacteroidales bacterium]
MDPLYHMLANGIRLVHIPVDSPVAHCGIFVNAGSRDETEKEHGIAHFIEHTIFKGTDRRSVTQVLNRLENVGADFNAFTGKEETCIHASFLAEYYPRTLELFQDIFSHSTFPEKDLEREKQVILDEITSYRDAPAEQIFDDFEEYLFAGHPLGRNILGTPKSLRRLKREHLLDFIRRSYRPGEMVIASVGKIDFRRLVRLTERYFGDFPDRGQSLARTPVVECKTFQVKKNRRTSQVHCILGSPAYPYTHEKRIPLALLNNLLGGPVMNSRLSLALREKNGLTYHNESNYVMYSDAGLILIYFGTDPVHLEKALSVVHKEVKRLREVRLSPAGLAAARKQITGQLAISQESNLATMLAMGKSYLVRDRFESIESILNRIHATTAEEIAEIANEIFDEANLSMLTYI